MKLMQIAEEHLPITEENMARKAVQMMAQQGAMPGPEAQPLPSEQLYGPQSETAPNTPAGTQSQSQQLTPQVV